MPGPPPLRSQRVVPHGQHLHLLQPRERRHLRGRGQHLRGLPRQVRDPPAHRCDVCSITAAGRVLQRPPCLPDQQLLQLEQPVLVLHALHRRDQRERCLPVQVPLDHCPEPAHPPDLEPNCRANLEPIVGFPRPRPVCPRVPKPPPLPHHRLLLEHATVLPVCQLHECERLCQWELPPKMHHPGSGSTRLQLMHPALPLQLDPVLPQHGRLVRSVRQLCRQRQRPCQLQRRCEHHRPVSVKVPPGSQSRRSHNQPGHRRGQQRWRLIERGRCRWRGCGCTCRGRCYAADLPSAAWGCARGRQEARGHARVGRTPDVDVHLTCNLLRPSAGSP
eukprot:m.439006 g.439006  ORF g.439006 m.439006 type:complete len:332 (-) comp18319_c0_seq1:48-1043(-)